MKHLIIFLTLLTVYSCSTSRHVTQLVERTSVDTLYLSSQQYDSIYVSRDHFTDRSRDTIYIKDSILGYRYKLLRDTVYKTQIDSIPVIREVEVVREVRHVPWYAKLLSWIGTLALILLLARLLLFLRGR